MSRPLLIGIGGYATSGKDTVADYLADHYGFYKTFMSKPLMKALLALDPLIVVPDEGEEIDELGMVDGSMFRYSEIYRDYGYDESKTIPEVRTLLQKLGTEVGRNILGENVWIDAMLREVEPILERGQSVVVTGIRFPNELDVFHPDMADLLGDSNGGRGCTPRTWWVDRGIKPINQHASDNSLNGDSFDQIVNNEGSIADLHGNIDQLMKEYS